MKHTIVFLDRSSLIAEMRVPAGRPVTFRLTSPDLIHGFQIVGTDKKTVTNVLPDDILKVAIGDLPGVDRVYGTNDDLKVKTSSSLRKVDRGAPDSDSTRSTCCAPLQACQMRALDMPPLLDETTKVPT